MATTLPTPTYRPRRCSNSLGPRTYQCPRQRSCRQGSQRRRPTHPSSRAPIYFRKPKALGQGKATFSYGQTLENSRPSALPRLRHRLFSLQTKGALSSSSHPRPHPCLTLWTWRLRRLPRKIQSRRCIPPLPMWSPKGTATLLLLQNCQEAHASPPWPTHFYYT
jgi:hypothetical protein